MQDMRENKAKEICRPYHRSFRTVIKWQALMLNDAPFLAGPSTDSNSQNTAKTGQDIQTIKGKEGSASYASLVREYREVIINIDQMLIADLSDLFMNVY